MFPALGAATLLLSAIAPPLHDDKATLSSGDATLFASSALPTLALVNREQASRCRQSCSAVSLSGLAPGFESLEGPFFYVGSLHERPVYSTTQGAIAPATGTFFLSWFADERYAHSGGVLEDWSRLWDRWLSAGRLVRIHVPARQVDSWQRSQRRDDDVLPRCLAVLVIAYSRGGKTSAAARGRSGRRRRRRGRGRG